MNPFRSFLYALSGTRAFEVIFALLILGPLPVSANEIAQAGKSSRGNKADDESIRRALLMLKSMGLVIHNGTELKSTGWRLTPAARNLLLPILQLVELIPTEMALPQPLPLDIDQAHLQGGEPVNNGADGEEDGIPGKPESQTDVLILLKETLNLNIDSFKNKNIGEPVPVKPELVEGQGTLLERRRDLLPATPKRPRWWGSVLRDLAAKGLPRAEQDDPFPLALRLCVERLRKLHCSTFRASQAVARSPWDADKISAEITNWVDYKASPSGKTLTDSGFPFFLACKIEAGDECPPREQWETRADPYADYLPYAANQTDADTSESDA
jgi:hypothetical protein